MRRLLTGRRLDPAAERVLFALVANRALAPSSQAGRRPLGRRGRALITGLPADHRRRLLPGDGLAAGDRARTWPKQVFDQVADLLNLEVDLLFFDTTSTYFETEEADEPVARDERGEPGPATADADDGEAEAGFRTCGKSKDHRDDLPAGRHRDGRHPRRDPGPGVVLAREHRRLRR